MVDISLIPTFDLQKDLKETDDDILLCLIAVKVGVTEYSGGSVSERLRINHEIREKITAELKKREVLYGSL